jgi:hypothetical protein
MTVTTRKCLFSLQLTRLPALLAAITIGFLDMTDTIPNPEPGAIAEYEAEVLAEVEAAAAADPLASLHSNLKASEERLGDVTQRYDASFNEHKRTVAAVVEKLDADYRASNAELIDEYTSEKNTYNKLKLQVQSTVRAEAERLLKTDPAIRVVRKDLGFHFKAPNEVQITDEKQAIEWSGKFLPMAVKTILDRKMFDGFVLKLPLAERPACVTVAPKITPVIKNK